MPSPLPQLTELALAQQGLKPGSLTPEHCHLKLL